MHEQEYLTTAEAADIIGCTAANVWLLMKDGKLRYIKGGNRHLTTRQWISEMESSPPTAICKGCGKVFVKNAGKQAFCTTRCGQRYRYRIKMAKLSSAGNN